MIVQATFARAGNGDAVAMSRCMRKTTLHLSVQHIQAIPERSEVFYMKPTAIPNIRWKEPSLC